MKRSRQRTRTIEIIAIVLCFIAASPHAQAQNRKDRNQAASVATSPVAGSGTLGRISKWIGVTGTNTYVLGDSNIFEDKLGKVGIGTTTPTSPLTVAGMIEITLGGLKFPDGSSQSTAFNASQAVTSLNGLTGNVVLAAGSNISITPSGNTLTIASALNHDMTLAGDGSAASPLGLAIPLVLSGAVSADGLLRVTNTVLGSAITADGASVSSETLAGTGLLGRGGNNGNGKGGIAVSGRGGDSDSGNGGNGVATQGGIGKGAGNRGGFGIEATGGIGSNGAAQGLAGKFNGSVEVTGNLSKGGGAFKIDHPLDPENRYLYHSFVESPDMMNIYNGNITTNENGFAVVSLPDYFEALNQDYRYQLTVIGSFAHAIIAEEINENRFTIRTSVPNVKVSWQVTGVRHDAFANQNRIPVEEVKPAVERGYFLHPEAFNQPEEKSINWANNPERMKQLKQRSAEAEKARKQQ